MQRDRTWGRGDGHGVTEASLEGEDHNARNGSKHQGPGEAGRTPGASRGVWLCCHLDLGLLTPRPGRGSAWAA